MTACAALPEPSRRPSGLSRVRAGPPAIAGLLAILLPAAAAVAIQSLWLPLDADVSWLITVSEKVLGGERLYVDIIEINPPASVWLYMPFVWLSRLLGVKPEAVVAAGFMLAGIVSVVATVRLSSKLEPRLSPILLSAILAFVALVLPMALFAQREHAALLLALPALAALARIADRKPLGAAAAVASGVAAGLVIVIKPYFVAAILFPAAWAAYRRRSLAPLYLPAAAACAAIAAYGAALAIFAPGYLGWLPVITATYAAMHEAWWKVLIGPALYPMLCLAIVLVLRPHRLPSLSIAWGLGGAGFVLAAYLQAKNYPNHWLAQGGLAIAAAFAVIAASRTSSSRAAIFASALAAVGLAQMYHWALRPDPAVENAIRQLAPARPTIIALSPQLTTGHPVTRNVGGRWVGSRAGLFTASGARVAGLNNPTAARAYRNDLLAFARDVTSRRPDVVLVHTVSKSWLMKEEAVARAMAPYHFATSAGDTEIWLRD